MSCSNNILFTPFFKNVKRVKQQENGYMFKSASEVDSEYNSYVGRRARKQLSNKTIILMGSGSAGKTTVFKQIKKRYQKYEHKTVLI